MKNGDKELLIQITAGRGPAECCWVVAQVLKILLKEAGDWKLKYTLIDREPAMENGTLYSVTIKLEGDKREEFFSAWEGSILWIGQSPYRRFHKRKNWFVGVNRLQDIHSCSSFEEASVRYEATRAGGPGGQHVNKVSTAIRATHLPTGISVLASDSRSQRQNKKAAGERLAKMLLDQRLKDQQASVRANWQQHGELARGNPVRVFSGSDFKPHHAPVKLREKRQKEKQDWKMHMFQHTDLNI
jgi:peptide chain release factor